MSLVKVATLSVYSSHDRELMFHGTLEQARERGVAIRTDGGTRWITLDGVRRRIVNHNYESNGSAQLWVLA